MFWVRPRIDAACRKRSGAVGVSRCRAQNGSGMLDIRPGKPNQITPIEKFNKLFPDNLPMAYGFDNLAHVRDLAGN